MKEGSLRAVVAVLALVVSLSAAARSDWAVQTSSDVCVWATSCVRPEAAGRVEEILRAIEGYWIPEPLPAVCTPSQDSPLSAYLGPSEVPLATIALYSDAEAMHRDLNRFDIGGLAASLLSPHDPRLSLAAFLDRLPEDAVLHSRSLLFACCHFDDDWERVVAHELVHALQLTQWDIAGPLRSDHRRLLMEGAAVHTEYALGYLDRFELRTTGPVSIWLAEGGDLREAPEFLLYDIGASLVDAIVRRSAPTALWSMLGGPCRSPILNRMLGRSVDFDAAFLETCGEPWTAFLDAWAAEAAAVVPLPGSEFIYRWLREAYGLRATLLAPLLGNEEVDRIEAVAAAVYLGAAHAADLDELDGVLRAAHGDPTPEVLEALHEREATLIDYARGRAGAFSDVAEVLRLGILARRGESSADDYVRAFVDVVNAYVPIAVRQTILDRPWW